MDLPAIPKPSTLVSLDSIVALETAVSKALPDIDDVDTLQEWRAQAAALEAYLRGKDLNGPMLAAQRKVEARIGQLLGDAETAEKAGKPCPSPGRVIERHDRNRFRILARGLDRGLPDECWRSARDPLIALIQEKYPVPRHIPTVVKSDGREAKPRAIRVKEIAKRAEQGMRAAQIASDLNISEQNVRRIAGEENINLPDAAIGKRAKLDAVRILTETVQGIDAYVSGLTLLDGMEMPDLPTTESADLMQALARSINGLKKLRIRMEKAYAGHDASAA